MGCQLNCAEQWYPDTPVEREQPAPDGSEPGPPPGVDFPLAAADGIERCPALTVEAWHRGPDVRDRKSTRLNSSHP